LVPLALLAALGRKPPLTIYGDDYPTPDGTCIRDYIQVSDLARAHSAALDYLRDGGTSEIFNCGYSRGYSVHEVIATVKRVSGKDFKTVLVAPRAGDPAAIVASSEKIRQTLGWKPEYDDLDQIVAQALAWERRVDQLKSAAATA
jgi:UDP-glucose 4-epimerase